GVGDRRAAGRRAPGGLGYGLGQAPVLTGGVCPRFSSTVSRRRITARLLASRGERSHLPAWDTWIQIGGLRKLRSGADRSFKTLPIATAAYAKRAGKSSRAAASIQVLAGAHSFLAPACQVIPFACHPCRRRGVDAGPLPIPRIATARTRARR